jgi:large subunit ribosomal protein L24
MKNNGKKYLKIGDYIKVIAGNYKGIIGTISSIYKKKNQFLITINEIVLKVKNKKEGSQELLPTFIHISNLMLWDKDNLRISRVNYKIQDGKKIRIFKKSNNIVN